MKDQLQMLQIKSKTLFKFQEAGGQSAAYTDPTTITLTTSVTRVAGGQLVKNGADSDGKNE